MRENFGEAAWEVVGGDGDLAERADACGEEGFGALGVHVVGEEAIEELEDGEAGGEQHLHNVVRGVGEGDGGCVVDEVDGGGVEVAQVHEVVFGCAGGEEDGEVEV